MPRPPFRYVLPAVFLPLTAVLAFVGHQQSRGINWGVWDGPPPRPTEIAYALSVPAAVAALPGIVLFALTTESLNHPNHAKSLDVLGYIYLALFVFGQWFFIGRWFDRRLAAKSHRPLSSARRLICVLCLCCLVLFFAAGINRIVHSGWMATWIEGAGIAAWSLMGITAIGFRMRGSIKNG